MPRERRWYTFFHPRRVLLFARPTPLELARTRFPKLNEERILDKFREHGRNPDEVLEKHEDQIAFEDQVAQVLKKLDIHLRLIKKFTVACKCTKWADLVMPIGGDGTFLLASKIIRNSVTPIIGLNPRYTRENILTHQIKSIYDVEEVFHKLWVGEFTILMRSRIRTTMIGEGLYRGPFFLHEKRERKEEKIDDLLKFADQDTTAYQNRRRCRKLPWLTLNEVQMGEFLEARTIALTIQADGGQEYRVRSSGICLCTGSGSKAWFRAINLQGREAVQMVVKLGTGRNLEDEETDELLDKYRRFLTFAPDSRLMSYVIREMYRGDSWPKPKECLERNMCRKLRVKSFGSDAGVILDSSISVPFNDGTTAIFEVHPEDALRTIVLQ
ncbi:NAD kinase 2, mitochondrial-like [Orussus abietinus]|uniref:NAD kinase 2, mitochondrial-like n=1 Tax=Orussus abietinus TaxID=222816 RepID=UPI00062522A7|nr:NAD kinase 2, mitochondrial-like [Orussus abietinus]